MSTSARVLDLSQGFNATNLSVCEQPQSMKMLCQQTSEGWLWKTALSAFLAVWNPKADLNNRTTHRLMKAQTSTRIHVVWIDARPLIPSVELSCNKASITDALHTHPTVHYLPWSSRLSRKLLRIALIVRYTSAAVMMSVSIDTFDHCRGSDWAA